MSVTHSELLKCRRCESRHDRYRLFKGIGSINYIKGIAITEFRCSNGHNWKEQAKWPPKLPDDKDKEKK